MKKILIIICIIIFIGFGGILWLFNHDAPAIDVVAVNDAVITAMQSESQNETIDILTDSLIRKFETMDSSRKSRDLRLQIFLLLYMGVFACAGILFYFYCERIIIKPFKKLQGFAARIAAGNLDIPLEMDKHNLFGAFTESFDLMREELHKARENERKADRSKKELVASLSHDIKTPVASIKAVTELMLLLAQDESREKEISQLNKINEKAEQINSLITNMFHSTLEELEALSVKPIEIISTAISGLIVSADYNGQVKPFSMQNCIVSADPIRLRQVFDNIISNSYKYARTAIEIDTSFYENNLVINIHDFGAGVPDDELPLLTGKFYRGKDSSDKSGYGLGLYISKYLMEQMSGSLCCENNPNGFTVCLMLRLVGVIVN